MIFVTVVNERLGHSHIAYVFCWLLSSFWVKYSVPLFYSTEHITYYFKECHPRCVCSNLR